MMKLKTLTGKFALVAGFVAIVATSPVYAGMEEKAFKEVAPVVEETESWWGAELSFGWDSRYIFRGVEILDDNNSLLWTDFSLSAYGFTAGVWFAEALTEDYNEFNAYLSYGYSLGPVDVEGGYIYYLFPKTDNFDTHEFFVSVSTGVIPFVTPSASFYYDIDAFEGGYLELTLSSSIPVVADVISIDPYVALAIDFEYNSEDSDLNHFETGIEVPIALSENITLSGYVKYLVALDAIEDFQDDEWWAGAAVTFSF